MNGSGTGRAVVIGGSVSGLLAGSLLRRSGWQVEIYERVTSELAGRGAGIVAQPELIATLAGLGIDTNDLGVEITTRKHLDVSGQLVLEYDCPQVLTAWERVYGRLRAGFPSDHYHRGVGFVGFTQNAQAARVSFCDGSNVEADLLVGADGTRSSVRQQCLPDVAPLYAGYVAWRALINESAFTPDLHREVYPYMTFCLPVGEQCIGYPVTGPEDGTGNANRPGHRRYNVVWYRPADEATKLQWLLTDESGVTHAISIPPPLLSRAAIADMRAAAEQLLAPQMRRIVRMIDEPLLQPIYDLATPRMAFGRVAVMGDAAFVARPHVAAGVSKAADDAVALTKALAASTDVEAGLKQYEAERLPVGRRIIERARHLGAYLQARRSTAEEAHSERYSIPRAVLAETAVLDFLYA